MIQIQTFIKSYFPDKINYYFLLLAHIFLGGLLFRYRFLGSFYGIVVVALGLTYIFRNRNKNNEILQVAGYLVGCEVLLRMTYGFLGYEFVKWALILLAALGIFYDGLSTKSFPYWIYLLGFLPSLFVNHNLLTISRYDFNRLVFDLSGPICLGFISIYTCCKSLSLRHLNKIILALGLPILSCGIYVFLFSPDIDIYLRGVCANPLFSGGFGSNQVSTVLGLGMVVFFVRLIIFDFNKQLLVVHLCIFMFLTYLCLMTFSRGGLITACAVSLVFLLVLFLGSRHNSRQKAKKGLIYFMAVLIFTSVLVNIQTNGLLLKRYTNKNHRGIVRKERVFDRKGLAEKQINMFTENPILGTGLGKGIVIKEEKKIRAFRSHNELTRLLANHGIIGLMNIVILIATPFFLFLKSKQNTYWFVFLAFWLLTINHSAMRTAAPAFAYALALTRISRKSKTDSC
ncbi:O-antigen ligase family protein [Flavobacterium sp. CYK-55]|uniref:O-antigen ligase family protein n=1 Tax=Flavobacterium sp. CYK-55 TaxID=2835529 RepID=UPI001BD0F425|nr:O-antigen ligase family protein [Flavobacterium sp. CYK-55]MBS7787161.1 O-antigen ligase family protein [Flavobacterium sp. CYK-55]